jgi:hypothetical protein
MSGGIDVDMLGKNSAVEDVVVFKSINSTP